MFRVSVGSSRTRRHVDTSTVVETVTYHSMFIPCCVQRLHEHPADRCLVVDSRTLLASLAHPLQPGLHVFMPYVAATAGLSRRWPSNANSRVSKPVLCGAVSCDGMRRQRDFPAGNSA